MKIVGTHGGALLPERAPGACSGSKIPRVYRPVNVNRERGAGSGERGAGSGERGAGNGERKSGNELSAETSIKIQNGR